MQFDVSALLLFHDDEDHIGTAIENAIRCLQDQGLLFELIAVDAGSRDNSVALLSMVRSRYPELRIVTAPNPRRAHDYAAQAARGRVLWYFAPAAAARRGTEAAFADTFVDAYRRVRDGQEHLVTTADHGVTDHGLIAERDHLRRAVRGLRAHGQGLPLGLTTRARLMRAQVSSSRGRLARRLQVGRWVAPLMSALSLTKAH